MQGKEKRKFRRLAVYHLVKYRFLSDASKVDFRLATLRDIGAGGVCLRTREPVAVSTPIELKINFPSLDTPVSTLTKVIWAKQRSKSGYYEIGAQFSELEEAIRKNIDARIKFVYNKLKQKKEVYLKLSLVKEVKDEQTSCSNGCLGSGLCVNRDINQIDHSGKDTTRADADELG